MSTSTDVNGGVAPAFLDDDATNDRAAGTNGQAAVGDLIDREVTLLNQLAHAGRPFYSFAQQDDSPGSPTIASGDITSCYRQVYIAANRGARSEGGIILGLQHQEDPSPGYQTGQGFNLSIGGNDYLTGWNYDDSTSEISFPQNMGVLGLLGNFGFSTTPVEIIIGGTTSNWPQPRAGTVWQNPENSVSPTAASYAGTRDLTSGGEIIGTRASSLEKLSSLSDVFRDTWFHQRPQIGWSTVMPGQVDAGGLGTPHAVDFAVDPQNLRYIHDQSYGQGGTTITASTPALTLPLANAAGGRRTQVRVYVFVYAAMTGSTDSGSIAIANKDSGGTMGTPTILADISVSGTTFAWYPSLGTWTPAKANWFAGYTGSAYDRVALCAASGGSHDRIRVAAFSMIVAPATS